MRCVDDVPRVKAGISKFLVCHIKLKNVLKIREIDVCACARVCVCLSVCVRV